MKFFKVALGAILTIFAVLLLIGVFVPEVDDEFEITIDKPLLQVYAGMANLERAPEWVIGLDSIQQTSGFLAMPGSTFRLYYSGSETHTIYDMKVTEMVPLESVKFKLTNYMFEFDVNVKFKAQGQSTRMNTYVQMRGKGFIDRAFLPLMKYSIMQVGKENFRTLKRLQEQHQ